MKIVNKQKNQITFSAEIGESLANAIRRYLNQIPILAIDEVEISKNDSALYDETVAHRMGLIPLAMDKPASGKKLPDLKLDVKGRGDVYSGNLSGGIKPVYDKIPITTLNDEQELKATATIRFGKGSEHSKFSPGLLFYRDIAKLKIDKDCPKEVVNICPRGVLKVENGKIVAGENLNCDLCEACVERLGKKTKEMIEVIPSGELLITLESFGQLDPKNVFLGSTNQLKRDLAEISKKISKS